MLLPAEFATRRAGTIADLHRAFNALYDVDVDYKAFYGQLAKREFGDFMRGVAELALSEMTLHTLGFKEGELFSEFERIVIQDGSSFAIKDALREVFPGRFKTVKPAAVELHVTMDLLCDAPTTVVLTPDTNGEHAYLPESTMLTHCFLLGDRGYPNLEYLHDVHNHDGYFLMRAKSNMNPRVVNAYREDGSCIDRFCDRKLKELTRIPKKRPVDLDVEWILNGQSVRFRMVVTWNKQTKEFQYLITNLARERYSVEKVCLAYKLRWQVELLFKEWKSYANLHAFDTEDPDIVEGLIWSTIIAAMMKRFLAHATQLIVGVETSTRKAAMCIPNVLSQVVKALIRGSEPAIRKAFGKVVEYLAGNAKRAHPKRDRKTGRSQLGLEPIMEEA